MAKSLGYPDGSFASHQGRILVLFFSSQHHMVIAQAPIAHAPG